MLTFCFLIYFVSYPYFFISHIFCVLPLLFYFSYTLCLTLTFLFLIYFVSYPYFFISHIFCVLPLLFYFSYILCLTLTFLFLFLFLQASPLSGALRLCQRLLHQRPVHSGKRSLPHCHHRQLTAGLWLSGKESQAGTVFSKNRIFFPQC